MGLTPQARRSRRARLRTLSAAAIAGMALAAAGGASTGSAITTPHAGADSAANMDLKSSARRTVIRFVTAKTGTLAKFHLHLKTEGADCKTGRVGYALGDGGLARVTIHPVTSAGMPDTAVTLFSDTFQPCVRHNGDYETSWITPNLTVTRGTELAVQIANVHSSPSGNYFSTNHLYRGDFGFGIAGANGRNERNLFAADAFYGLDPREVVGWSADGGATWRMPGGPYGANSGGAFLPTYIQEYADGHKAGQPYYWAMATSGTVTMVYPNVPVTWTISQLGAYTSTTSGGASTVRLYVDGVQRGSADLSGAGMLRASITPVTVNPGQTVKVQTTAGSSGLNLYRQHADANWTRIMNLAPSASPPFYLEGSVPAGSSVPVYPLPMYGRTALTAEPEPAPAPAPEPEPTPDLSDPDLALGKPTRASSSASKSVGPAMAVDGASSTRWLSKSSDSQWWQVDLGSVRAVGQVTVAWDSAYATRYQILTSTDASTWGVAADIRRTSAGTVNTTFTARQARYVRVRGITRGTTGGYAFWTASVFAPAS
jgi:hypothetical protein